MQKKFIHLLLASTMITLAAGNHSCSTKGTITPDITDNSLRISHINIPIIYNISSNEEITFRGLGIDKSDVISFKATSPTASDIDAVISKIENDVIQIAFPALINPGKYNIILQRGSASQLLGQTTINHVFNANIPDKENMTIKGTVFSGGKGVSNVIVSDGEVFAKTDDNGIYYLPSAKKHGYVFITVPSNYEVKTENTVPQFFKNLAGISSQTEIADFELFPVNNDQHAVVFFADIHLANRTSDLNQFQNGFINDIKATAAYYKAKNIKFYGLTLGDQSWDQYWYANNFKLADYLKQVKDLDFPIYNVIGNHDYDPYVGNNDWLAAAQYRNLLGPTYYSINIGKVHYVILDNMLYKNADGKFGVIGSRDYDNILSDEQLNWLAKDLSYITDKSTPIVIAMHVPMYTNPSASGAYNNYMKNSPALASALASFQNVKVITGHSHINYRITPAGSNIVEHNIGAVSATWWWTGNTGYADNHICKDGSPGGYAVWEALDKNQTTYYKGIGFDKNYQFRAYDLNTVHITADKHTPNANATYKAKVPGIAGEYATANTNNQVLLNIWGYQDDWKITIKENGVTLPYTRVSKKDPLHLISYDLKRINVNADPTSSFTTINTAHMFLATASSPTSTLDITVEDHFGNKYQETMIRPKAFNTSMK